jgi:geranylgeranylglycerol-phosphate geranylgeranyltransferase
MMVGMLRLMRLYYALPLSGGFVVILLYLRGGSLAGMQMDVTWSVISLACLISGGHVFNDIFDTAVDRINCPWRPLPSGQVTAKAAVILAAALFATSIACACMCRMRFAVVVTIVSGVLTAYDVFGKRMGVMKNVVVACVAVSLYPLAFALADPVWTTRLPVLFIHPVWLLLSSLGYEMLKDIRDRKGDALGGGHQAYAASARFERAAKVAIVAGAAVSLVPFVAGYCGYVYLAAAMGAVGLAIWAVRSAPTMAIRCVYAEVALVTAGSLVDIIVYGIYGVINGV